MLVVPSVGVSSSDAILSLSVCGEDGVLLVDGVPFVAGVLFVEVLLVASGVVAWV